MPGRLLSRLPRRRGVPEAVRSVPLEPGERRLAWGMTVEDRPVVASDLGLRAPGAELVRWAQVEKVGWQRPVLVVLQVAQIAGTGPRLRLELAEAGELPEVVRAQVTTSVGWSAHYRLGSAGVRVVGRRRPGQDDLDWQLVYDAGTDLSEPLVRAQAEELLLGARRTIG